MTDRLSKNLDDIAKRRKYEKELSELDLAIKYHKTIAKYLSGSDDEEIQKSLEYHKKVLAQLKAVQGSIAVKREQVKLMLESRGLIY